jgi:DNA-binding transcriptional MerR regulator
MRIGELAKVTGITPSRIRFYESEGLITPPPRQGNGYRNYSADVADLLKIIDRAQRAGFLWSKFAAFYRNGRKGGITRR